ncbi:hypothetical protein [Halocatena marina]|uniref:Uncharacterized protein n=1 Tax=Halocatena marina TaxID=2934937 RepID=A0ABD5YMP6_9EURY|nr:hypothetical protein [Halocatena marina]
MNSRSYSEATEKALEAIESDHEDLFCSITRIDENGATDIEVISGVDSSTIEEDHGLTRLEQAAMHIQYLSDISGMSPVEIAGNIARIIENGAIDIEISEAVLEE